MIALINPKGNAQNNEKAIVVRSNSAVIIVTLINDNIEKIIDQINGFFFKSIKKNRKNEKMNVLI